MDHRKFMEPKLFVECVEKETLQRVAWNEKYKDRVHLAATYKSESDFKNYEESDILDHAIKGCLPILTRDNIVSKRNRLYHPTEKSVKLATTEELLLDHTIVSTGLGNPEDDPRLKKPNTDMRPDPIMRLVPPQVTRLLYKKISGCTKNYLKERTKTLPEDRYYFAECSSWDYRWRWKDSKLASSQKSTLGNVYLTQRAIWSHVGPQPDPIHYKSAEKPTLGMCLI